ADYPCLRALWRRMGPTCVRRLPRGPLGIFAHLGFRLRSFQVMRVCPPVSRCCRGTLLETWADWAPAVCSSCESFCGAGGTGGGGAGVVICRRLPFYKSSSAVALLYSRVDIEGRCSLGPSRTFRDGRCLCVRLAGFLVWGDGQWGQPPLLLLVVVHNTPGIVLRTFIFLREALLRQVPVAESGLGKEEPWWYSDLNALKDMLSNWVNVLLVAVPMGIIAGALKWGVIYVFCLNFTALIPLALLLGDVTEDLALRYGSVIGGLINATFGNIVEIILSIAALFNGLYDVVAASLLGSILSNLLLVTGCSFFFGGLYNKTQRFNPTGTQASSSLLFVAALAFLIPTGAGLMFTAENPQDREDMVLRISRGTAVVMLLWWPPPDLSPRTIRFHLPQLNNLTAVNLLTTLPVSVGSYGCYLGFQLGTHVYLFQLRPEEKPMLSLFTSITLLAAITITVAVASENLTSSLETFSKRSGLGKAFLGTIVLPIAGNACEHMTAVIVATKNKMDL
ncbi:hypothetical protein VOLCADRAFT_87798, partial [Volvox carteri f. nagariensis]